MKKRVMMNGRMKLMATGLLTSAVGLLTAPPAVAHPNGVYVIDDASDVTVTFRVEGACPTNIDGALRGSLRTLTFSLQATLEPYRFVTGYYVEHHVGAEEVYTQTNAQCVPTSDGAEIPASRSTFAGYSLRRASN